MINQISNSRWFALIVLICCTASGFLWYINIHPAVLPFVIGGIPLVLLVFSRRQFTIPPVYHVFLSIFLLTAFIGSWAAYQPEAAAQKFWILVGAVLIFYALALQPLENADAVFWGLALLGVIISVYFLLTYNPAEHPADLASINQVMLDWIRVRPTTTWSSLESNFVGGILAVLVVCTLALLSLAWQRRRMIRAGVAAILLLFQTITLWLTSSRSAWISLGIGLSVWLWWRLSKLFARRLRTKRAWIFRAGLLAGVCFALVLLALFHSQILAVANMVPGASSPRTRAGLFINAVKLIPDFWLTGGGLQSFAGLYSQYILDIPFLFFKYGYNLYLDVAIEQGIFGLAALLLTYLVAFFSLLVGFSRLSRRSLTRRRYYMAVFAALIVLAVNGALDDPFYGESGTPLLFVLPGLAVMLLSPRRVPSMETQTTRPSLAITSQLTNLPGFQYWASGLAVIFFGLAISFSQPLLAAVNSSLGAVEMAKVELKDFPAEEWSDMAPPENFSSAANYFERALWYNPAQRTANHRLGLIAMQLRNFEDAAGYLEAAQISDPDHRGIRKALGYTFVWLGEFPRAVPLLSILPETETEMNAYIVFWQQQGRPDLAEHAQRLINHFNSLNTP